MTEATTQTEFSALLATVSDDDRLWIEERAAVREYDAGFPRQEAERLAVEDFQRRRKSDTSDT